MCIQFENPALISADPLKNSISIKQSVIPYGNFRVLRTAEGTVDKNLELTQISKQFLVLKGEMGIKHDVSCFFR